MNHIETESLTGIKTVLFIFSIFFIFSGIHCSENFFLSSEGLQNTVPLTKNWKIYFGDQTEFSLLNYRDDSWRKIQIDSSWEKQGLSDYDGTAWYRIHISDKDLIKFAIPGVNLGKIDDVDEAYFNGVKIGGEGNSYPLRNPKPDRTRIYIIPAGLIQSGNVLAVRVTDSGGEGGLKIGIPFLGNYPDLITDFFIGELITMIFAASFFLTGLYGLLFYFRQKKSEEFLYFFILSACISFIVINESEIRYYIYDHYFFWNHLKLISVFFLGPALLRYFLRIFHIKTTRDIQIYEYISAGMTFTLFTNSLLIRQKIISDNEFHDFLAFFVWIPSLLYFFYKTFTIIGGRIQKRNLKAKLMSLLIVILFLSLLTDALLITGLRRYESTTMQYGFFIFLLGIILSYSEKFSRMQFYFEHHRDRTRIRELPQTGSIQLTIHCFGLLEVIDISKGNISESIMKTRSRFKLFELLIVNYGKGIRREEAADILWPKLNFARSSTNLNSLLHRLRKMFTSPDIILDKNGFIQLNTEIVDTDFSRFEFLQNSASDLLRKNQMQKTEQILQQINKLYRGHFFHFDPNFEQAVRMADYFSLLYRNLNIDFVKFCIQKNEIHKALAVSRLLLEKDNTDEEAWNLLIEALTISGNKAKALEESANMSNILKSKFNIDPDQDISSIYK